METISGIVTAILIIIITRLLSKYFTTSLMATTILVAIAFIYVGFSLMENPFNLIILEIVVALIFYFLAIIGYTKNGSLIAYGIMIVSMQVPSQILLLEENIQLLINFGNIYVDNK